MNARYTALELLTWSYLTLTRVVFELLNICINLSLDSDLTLTRVVFELLNICINLSLDSDLTLTRVVFECILAKVLTLILSFNFNKSCI